MATNYITLKIEKVESKKTVFSKLLDSELNISEAISRPEDYKNVIHIGNDACYGDVFKAWDDDENNFCLFLGFAGDEFKK